MVYNQPPTPPNRHSSLSLSIPHTITHHSFPPPPASPPHLPRGECRFILLHPTITNQRCSCQGFQATKLPDSRCACGHQACYHLHIPPPTIRQSQSQSPPSPPLTSTSTPQNAATETVPLAHHLALVAKLRTIQDELETERRTHMSDTQALWTAIEGLYSNFSSTISGIQKRVLEVEDRTEGAEDRSLGAEQSAKRAEERLIEMGDDVMAVEVKVGELEDLVEGRWGKRRKVNREKREREDSGVVVLDEEDRGDDRGAEELASGSTPSSHLFVKRESLPVSPCTYVLGEMTSATSPSMLSKQQLMHDRVDRNSSTSEGNTSPPKSSLEDDSSPP
ncbi:MAG: hypothetical protein M1834_000821 [Cirrosporium novae-zelandiae]|nr:MAG: hypothetical protein M1834_000821 [Cirrosporium novae-zelandiae]